MKGTHGARAWSLAAAGDIMLEHPPAENPLHDLLRRADFAFANLEAPLSDRGHPADKLIVLRSAPSLASVLPDLGLSVVSFAHNHALDFGIPALEQTLEVVRAVGVRVVGAGASLDEAVRPAFTECPPVESSSVRSEPSGLPPVRVAWLGFASTLPTGSAAAPGRPGVAPLRVRVRIEADASVSEEQPGTSPYVSTEVVAEDLDRAAAAVRAAARESDVVIVSVHWGVPPGWAAPFQGILADYQQPAAHALIEAGAAAVLGHHPHCLHGVEVYRGRPILYSMGNFLFHAMGEGRRFELGRPAPPYRMEAVSTPELAESAVFVLEFDGARCRRLVVHPTAGDPAGEQRAAAPEQAFRILARIRAMSAALGTELRTAGETGLIDLT